MNIDNQEKFLVLRSYNLPVDQYAFTGSGPLGIRNIKAIGDIDIIVTQDLWHILSKKYGITDENGVKKNIFPDGIIEAFSEGSFYKATKESKIPSLALRIKNAEIIDFLPFDSIENILFFKRKDRRDKDLKDIALIEEWMKKQSKQ